MFIPDSAVYRRSRSPIPPLFKRPMRSYAQPSLTIHMGTLTASHTWTKVDLHGPIGPRTTVLRLFCDPRSEPRASPRSAHDGPLQDRAAVLSAGQRVGIGSRRGDLCTWRGWRTAPVQGLGKEQPTIGDTIGDRARGRARARARRWVNRGWGVVQGSRGVARTGGG